MCSIVAWLAIDAVALGQKPLDGNRLTYLDSFSDPYYPGREFPKLTTPQWVGEPGVDAVITLGIDDMRDVAKYEAYLRPILNRLKKIDGRAAVSIMTCQVDPKHPQLQAWLKEGVSIETHTIDHPCPCLKGNDFEQAQSTYHRCVDLMFEIPNNHPVAFRFPCMDSLNTPSPRAYAEILNRVSPQGNFLQASTSVTCLLTPEDPQLPAALTKDAQGNERFRRYIPFPSFVNKIDNYPYPYLIGEIWELPCTIPDDWQAQNIQRPNNPRTVEDLVAALEATTLKQGIANVIFHPHNWIRADQMVEVVDQMDTKYKKRIRFLTFQECVTRFTKNLLLGEPVRATTDGGDNGIRLVDLNNDGYLDVLIGNERRQTMRIWRPAARRWQDHDSPIQFTGADPDGKRVDLGAKFGTLANGEVIVFVNNASDQSIYTFVVNKETGQVSIDRDPLPDSLKDIKTSIAGVDQGVRFRDLDGDGTTELIVANPTLRVIYQRNATGAWKRLSQTMPAAIVDEHGRDNGARFVDLDKDGHDDLVIANDRRSNVILYDAENKAFGAPVKGLKVKIPSIVRDGKNFGAWFARDYMWVQNETTHKLPDGVDRRSFTDLLGAADPNPRSAESSLGAIRVRPGFTVELVVAEPLVQDPIALDWGPDGKLWVVEMADYPLGLDDRGKPGGRVRYLEDTNDDGKYDRSTLFLDGIAYPTGVMAWRDGVLVSAAPSLFFARDTDGDGLADERTELYRGFGKGNQQHRVNGFEWGLDNWLYLANGDSGGVIESVKTGAKVDIRGRDLRIRPQDGAIEAQAGQTQFGRHRDDHGNWFGCSNPIPVRHYVLADHYLARNLHYPAPPSRRDLATNGNAQLFPISRVLSHWSGYKPPQPGERHKFTSACSTTIYRDNLFGEAFAQNTFTCEPVHNAIHRRVLTPDGISFQSRRPADEPDFEFLASTDSWFRPTTVTTGPDGALWVVDMYRLVIEHPEWIDNQREKELFLRAGHDRGRIYRIFPTDRPPRKMLVLDPLHNEKLVAALDSPNGRQRDRAQELLIERKATDAAPALRSLLAQSTNPLARLHALCTLDGLGVVSAKDVERGLRDPHSTVQRHAIRIAEPWLKEDEKVAETLLSAMTPLAAADADPHVRLQLAYSLGAGASGTVGAANHKRATNLLARLAATSPQDPLFRAAIFSSLSKRNLAPFYAALADVAAEGGSPDSPLSGYQEAVLQMASRLKDATLTDQIVTELIGSVNSKAPRPSQLIALADAMNAASQKDAAALAVRVEEVNQSAIRLARSDQAIKSRLAALQFIGATARAKAPGATQALEKMVDSRQPTEVQRASIEALAKAGDDGAFSKLLSKLSTLSPAIGNVVVDRALARDRWAKLLVEGLATQRIPLEAMGPLHRQILLAHQDESLRARAASLLKQPSSTERKAVVEAYLKEIPLLGISGDPTVGQAHFKKHCAKCHKVGTSGHQVGPDLRALKNRSALAMLTAMLDPNQAVEDKYRSYSVLTHEGVRETGVISDESSNTITLQMAEGKSKVILRTDIERIQSSGKSLMPEGLEKELPPAAMGDLLAYLSRLEQPEMPAKSFAGNQPTVIRANPAGQLSLTAAASQIYGPSLIFESKYKNLGFWASPNDLAKWTIQVKNGGVHEVWLDYACHDNTAGSQFEFTIGDENLTGTVKGTGAWDQYQFRKVGEVTLNSGETKASFSSLGKLRSSHLLDLRTIVLKPKGD